MSLKHVLVFWTKSKKISIIKEASFVKAFGENGEELPLSEGALRTALIGEKRLEGKILRICSSKKYLESLLVTKEGTILLHGTKPPSKECLAKRSKLQDDGNEIQDKEKQILKSLSSNISDQLPVDIFGGTDGSSKCNNGCPTCCSGSMPQFPKLPDGFLSTLVSLAEYFQSVQKTSEDSFPTSGPIEISPHLNTWQWASREKVELKKGAGVWVDAIKLERILGQAQITKKPPHQTLVKSLLTHLLGIEKYIETTAEKIDRRLLSAVVGFANAKYPELAQPIERYYRCINLNRGYLLKRKNEGAFDGGNGEDSFEGTGTSRTARRMEMVRQFRKHPLEEPLNGIEEPRNRRTRVRVLNRDQNPVTENNSVNRFGSSDQVIIPLDPQDGEECPVVPDNNIIIVHSEFSPQNFNNMQKKYPPQNASSIQNKFPPQNSTDVQNKFPSQNSTNVQNKFPPQNFSNIQNRFPQQNPINSQNKFLPLSSIHNDRSNSQATVGNSAINEHAYFRISSGSVASNQGSFSNSNNQIISLDDDDDSIDDSSNVPF